MNLIILMYERKPDVINMLSCCMKGCEVGNLNSVNKLIEYFAKLKDYDNLLKYYILKNKIDIEFTMEKLKTDFTENIEPEIKDDTCKKIRFLIKYKEYINDEYEEELNETYAIYHQVASTIDELNIHYCVSKNECCICYDTTYELMLNCKHSVCFVCYDKIDKCPLCNMVIRCGTKKKANRSNSISRIVASLF